MVTRTDNANAHRDLKGDHVTDESDNHAQAGVDLSDPTLDAVDPATDDEVIDDIDEVSALRNAITERDDYLDQLQRSRADFANFRRRNDQERAMVRRIVGRDVLSQFLPVIDDLDRALAAIPETERESGWVKGVSMIQVKLNGTVERLGVTKIDALHQPFDPAFHEAVATEPGTSGSHVIEIYQNGYQLGDLLVRPAMVKTGDAPASEPGTDNDDHDGQQAQQQTQDG